MGDMHLRACVQQAQAGDATAVGELIAHFRPRIFRYCLSRLGSAELAEDMTQEVSMALVSALPAYEDRGVPFAAFVFGIASNKVLTMRRTLARRVEDATADLPERVEPAPGPAELAEQDDSLHDLLGQLDALPERQRDVLLLRVVSGLSAEEVAAALDLTPGNVRVLQHRALATLRGRLATAPAVATGGEAR